VFVVPQSQDYFPDRISLFHQLVDDFPWHKLVDSHRALLRFYFEQRVFVDYLPVDRIVHELASELDPLVDRGRGHPLGLELPVKFLRMAYGDLRGTDFNRHCLR